MKILSSVDKVVHKISIYMSYVAAVAVFFMAAVTFVDVIFRYFIHISMRGSQEMVEIAMPVLVYGAMGMAIRTRKLISIEAVTDKFPKRVRKTIVTIMYAICVVAMALMAWKLFERTGYYLSGTFTTAVAKIPYAPFYAFTALGCTMMTIEFILNIIKDTIELVTTRGQDNTARLEEVPGDE